MEKESWILFEINKDLIFKIDNEKIDIQAINNIIKKYKEHLEVIRYLSSSKYQLITALGFEDRFLAECDIANLKKFENILLSPETQND